MTGETLSCLRRQFDTAWKLAEYHLDGLTNEECLWRPAEAGLHVHQDPDGAWIPDWPTHEGYDLGPPSIAWTMWHMCFWWRMAIDHSIGDAALTCEDIRWPGSAEAARAEIAALKGEWCARVLTLDEGDLASTARTRWPFRDRPFSDVLAWVNVELTKNAAEIGYARFLYAVRPGAPQRA